MLAMLLAVPALLQLSSTGGLAGRGNGQATISSAYEIDVIGLDGKHCVRPLSRPQKERLGLLLRQASPAKWRKTYGKGGPDQFNFSLVYLRGRRSYRVRWSESEVETLPVDLGIIVQAVAEMRASALEQCGLAPAGREDHPR